jgi:ATP-binding cassette subfamily F protein uup
METDYEDNETVNAFNKVSAFLDHHAAWNIDEKIERIIKEFDLEQFEDRSVDLLSGGEQRRVALATLLLQKPDILLLDEPTNHLDVYMVEYLEELILKEQFTLVFISHDRYFIDQVATKTVEVDNAALTTFSGGYSDYLEQKQQILEVMQKQHENLLRLVRRENQWYARGVRARLKRNEGRKARLMDLRNQAKSNPSLIKTMSIQLEREKKSFQNEKGMNKQKMLFEIEDISKTLGNKVLIKNFSHRILQKDIIAVVGHNGTGKSTLLKILLERMPIDSGKIKRGDFKIGYFDQHREMLDDNKDLLETFCPNGGDRVDVQGTNMHVFGYLKNFLFPKEFLSKKIGVLSGGEKNRVALALLFTKKVDCLILDEPTNDLDIPTINILEEKLESFPGAIILVSHDRYFIDKIASKLLIFKGQGLIEESYQPYSEYLELEKEMKTVSDMAKEFNINDTVRAIESAKPKEEKASVQNPVKLTFKEKIALEKLPEEIDALESEIEAFNKCLADPDCYAQEGITAIAEKLAAAEASYEEKSTLYLELLDKQEQSS